MNISLVMIVKNESIIIKRCLESVKPIIGSIIISDTGSTDNTVELIQEFLKENNIPGKVYVDEWKNFGYNRSKSITNAQEWLKQEKYDLDKNYLLTIDADMIFCIEPSFNVEKLGEKDSWLLKQVNPSMSYYNKRIFRSSKPYKCIGVTHEYWGCDESDCTEDKLETLYINDIGDGGAKADKFERDIRLLTQGLIDEPKNERYYFYLAQSYSDAGYKDKAIEFYKKRIEAGGWYEEIFIAYMRLADIYNELNQIENATYYWSMGYEHLPSRAETLFRMIHKYRLLGKNNIALTYLKSALQIEYPKDQLLFIEHPVYQYRLLEELSISGFYTPKKTLSFIVCDWLILSPIVPDIVKNQCINNIFFYMPKIDLKSNQIFDIKLNSPFKNSSASLFKTNIGYSGCVRAVNYSISKKFEYSIRDDQNIVRTKNFWVVLNNKGEVIKKNEIEISSQCKTVRNSHIKGLEDMRLCKLNDENIVGFAVDWEYGKNNHPSVCVCKFERDESSNYYISKIVATNYNDHECQKNWAPFSENGNLFAIYSHHPLTILSINKDTGDTKVHLQKKSSYDLSRIRGSTSPIKLPNGYWLMLTHEVLQRDTRKYYHRFMLYNKEWELQEVGLPFYFKEFFVEFSLSIIYNNNDVHVCYSTEDNTTEMFIMDFAKIPWMPKDIYKFVKDKI